ncbi:hypothetical protein XJ76305_0271 [Enterococcus faecalis]|nr:hypothetical protein XJ76305_0271 [Enterococcus faecalis]OSH47416.1 hypothetical protein YM392_0455 [Enterococcus faecalis]
MIKQRRLKKSRKKFSNDSLSAFLYAKGGESGDVEGNTFNRRD